MHRPLRLLLQRLLSPARQHLSDALGTSPITKVYSLGSTYVPPPVYAGGLRHHSAGPLASAMYADGSSEPMAIDQLTSFRAGMLFCETEGILPAPESAHAVAGMIDVVSRHPRREAPLIVLVQRHGSGSVQHREQVPGTGRLGSAWSLAWPPV